MTRQAFEYKVGDRQFVQQPMVLGQWAQMMKLVPEALDLKPGTTRMEYALALEEKLYLAIAIALREDAVKLRDKDVYKLAEFFEEEMDAETSVKVLRDFFDCNPIASLIEGVSGITDRAAAAILVLAKTLRAKTKTEAEAPETPEV